MNKLAKLNKVSPSPDVSPTPVFLLTTPEDDQRVRDGQVEAEDGQSGGGGETEEEGVEEEEEEEREQGRRGCCVRCPPRAVRRAVWGVVLGGGVALAWAGGTHSARRALERLPAPFFITWFCSLWNLLLFPLFYLGHLVGAESRLWPAPCFRQCGDFLVEGTSMTVRGLVRGSAPFSLLWSLSGYLYLLALRRIAPGDASAILCCSQAFLFLLSWIALKDRFMGVRIVAVILSITGIVMMAYADGFHSDSITGVALAVGSASTSALFKVLFRRRVGEVRPGASSVLMSCVGLCSCLLHSWVCLLLYLTHLEHWPATQVLPWDTLCTMAALLLAFNVLVNLGSALAYPSLLSLGMLLSIPANTAVDACFSAAPQVSQVRVAAAGVIGVGYLLLLLPERWDERLLRWAEELWQGGWREESLAGEEAGGPDPGTRTKPRPAGIAALTS